MAEKDDYLADILVDLGYVSAEQVDEARREAAGAVAEQYLDRIRTVVCDSQIELAVAIKIEHGGEPTRLPARRTAARGTRRSAARQGASVT